MEHDIFGINEENVNVEEIIKEIKKRAKVRRIKEVDLDFENLNVESCQVNNEENIKMLNDSWNIQSDRHITSHRPIIGNFIVFMKKIIRKILRWYINPIVDEQREYNANVTRAINAINDKLNKNIDEQSKQLTVIKNEIDSIKEQVNFKIDNIESNVQGLNKFIKDSGNEFRKRLLIVEENIRNLNQEQQKLISTNIARSERIGRIERMLRNKGLINNSLNIVNDKKCETKSIDIDYLMFEQLFRGSEENIRENQKKYLKYFENCNYVLDIGCGRGEFLQLLKECNINCLGIDTNEDMIIKCKDKELNAELEDAYNYFDNYKGKTLNGIFCSQVIEHLNPNKIVELVTKSYKTLEGEGILIVETINPKCLYTYSSSYPLDLTHINPVHPETLKFIFESEGFNNVEIKYSNKVNIEIPELLSSQAIDNIDSFNKSMKHINELLFGYQDYAVIGYK